MPALSPPGECHAWGRLQVRDTAGGPALPCPVFAFPQAWNAGSGREGQVGHARRAEPDLSCEQGQGSGRAVSPLLRGWGQAWDHARHCKLCPKGPGATREGAEPPSPIDTTHKAADTHVVPNSSHFCQGGNTPPRQDTGQVKCITKFAAFNNSVRHSTDPAQRQRRLIVVNRHSAVAGTSSPILNTSCPQCVCHTHVAAPRIRSLDKHPICVQIGLCSLVAIPFMGGQDSHGGSPPSPSPEEVVLQPRVPVPDGSRLSWSSCKVTGPSVTSTCWPAPPRQHDAEQLQQK